MTPWLAELGTALSAAFLLAALAALAALLLYTSMPPGAGRRPDSQHQPPAAVSQARAPLLPNTTRTNLVVGLLASGMVIAIASAVSTMLELRLISALMRDEYVSDTAIYANDLRQGAIGIVALVVYLATALAFCFWIHRAHHNLRALAARGLRFSPGWAVGWFFVPFWNLVRPYQVMKEIWQASDPEADPAQEAAWTRAPVSPLVPWWWASFLIMNLSARVANRLLASAEAHDAFVTAESVSLAADILTIAAAALAIALVTRLNVRQHARGARLARAAIAMGPAR
jgi:hypothetical protein